MMFGKKSLAAVVVLFLCFSGFASDAVQKYLPSLHRDSVYPKDIVMGQTSPASDSETLQFLSSVLSEEYSFEWSEKYFAEENKKALAMLYSSFLSSHIPTNQVLFSKEQTGSDKTVSVMARFSSGETATFTVIDGKIYSLSIQ